MSDEAVPETLETIAAKITALSKSIDDQFGTVDDRFGKVDERFAETRAQLGVKIEAVDARVSLVYDVLIAMRKESEQNAREHETFTKRLDKHDTRILALEKPGPSKL